MTSDHLVPNLSASATSSLAGAVRNSSTGIQTRVCHVVSSLMYGGGQRFALDLVAGLGLEPGFEATLVLFGDRLSPEFPRVEPSLWVHLRGYDGRYNRPFSLGRAALALRSFLRSRRVDIVHSHGWDCDAIVGLARVGLPIRHVVHQHILADWASSPAVVHRVRRTFTRCVLNVSGASWVAVSGAVKKSLGPLRWLPPDTVRVIWNGVDIERFRPRPIPAENYVPVIGVAARLAPMKGLEYLVEAVAQLHGRGLDCQLRIAGEGPSRGAVESLARSLKIQHRVFLLGHQQEMPDFYRSLSVFALPSVSTEGLPLSILEAMATGLPVVSTLISGIPEAVVHGITGTLVPARDAHALADALEPLLRSRALRERMGQEARHRAEAEFSLRRMTGRVAALYGEVAVSGRGSEKRA